jgi:hypothetical protein
VSKIGIVERFLCWLLPYKDITKIEDGQTVVQLRRWFIFGRDDSNDELETRQPRLCIHKLNRSDLDRSCPHDHPWWFVTTALWGSYSDEHYRWDPNQAKPFRDGPFYEEMTFGKVRFRSENHLHRVILKDEKPCWTLVWMAKPTKRWGFVDESGKWIDKDDFLNLKD